MNLLLFPLPGNMPLAISLRERLGCEIGEVEIRHFPDGETYLRLRNNVAGRAVAFICTLDHPDSKYLPLTFAASAARDLGAAGTGLVTPYLAYMRQDARFRDGEAITSRQFDAPYVVLRKHRFGDRNVEIELPDLSGFLDRRPVLVDDIVSSARTMIEASRQLIASGMAAPVCLAVHALFSADANEALKAVSHRIATANTVPHESNAIDISAILAEAIIKFVEPKAGRNEPRSQLGSET